MKADPVHPVREEMPAGIHHVYLFEIFNTFSFTVVLGPPMLLFLQHLNASATVLALAGGLSPFLNILQIPAAPYVEKIGYRPFVLSGWTSRSFLIILMAVVAFLPEKFDLTTRLTAFLVLAFLYNTLRGISVCGVLPWFTQLVPESRRGEFLARDQLAAALATITSMFLYGQLLRGQVTTAAFGQLFVLSTLAAFCSLVFMRRIPKVKVAPEKQSRMAPPWKAILFHPPFYRYLIFIVVINLSLGASTVFWVPYFRTVLHITDSGVLIVSGLTNLVTAMALYGAGALIDRVGNKPILTTSVLLLILHYGGWASVAAGLLPFNNTILAIQCLTAGVAGALWNLANVRMVMGLVPVMGRAHFLALYSVATNLTLGLVPLAWGPVLDALRNWKWQWTGWCWNAYSLMYVCLAVITVVGTIFLQYLSEPQAMKWDQFMRELLVTTPRRALGRIINRLRPNGGLG